MKYLFLLACILTFNAALGQNAGNRDITIKLSPYSNCFIYMGSYYGMGQISVDTAWLDAKSEGHFKGKQKLTGGLYFIVSPDNNILMEFLMDSGQHFSIVADTMHMDRVTFIGSPENDLFKKYLSTANEKKQRLAAISAQMAGAKTKADSASIKYATDQVSKEIRSYVDSIIETNPASLTALFVKTIKRPGLPDGLILKNNADSLAAWYYVKKHYWDDIPFNDDRLLHIPFFEPKIDDYLKFYVSPAADSVIKELQYMLLYARTGKEIYPYLLMKFTNRYFSPEHIGQNKVLIYLFENFYEKGDSALLNETSKKVLFDRVFQLMANQTGDPAPPLEMTDGTGKSISLYNIVAPYTLVVFWDPTCSHCKEQIPRIDSIYRAKWKALGLKLYSVNINNSLMKELFQFAKDKHLSPDWIHTYQTDAAAKTLTDKGLANYHQLYDVYETPTIYLLDSQKRIIAKRLSVEQFDAVLTESRKKKE